MPRLASQIHKIFDVKVELKDLFVYTVLEEQALLISGAGKDAFLMIPAVKEQDGYVLSSSQRRLRRRCNRRRQWRQRRAN